MGRLLQDTKYALRQITKSPGVAAVVVLTLAIGIGANSAIFSLVHGILLQPLPVPEPDRLAIVWDSNPSRGWDRFAVSWPNFLDYRAQNTVFESMTAWFGSSFTLTGVDEPERLRAQVVGPDFFETFGIQPEAGRGFSSQEYEPGNGNVVVLGHEFWERRFAADPQVVGRTIMLSQTPYTVIGIFFDQDIRQSLRALGSDLYVPMTIDEDLMDSRGAHYIATLGRMKPGVKLNRVSEEMQAIAARLEQEYPRTNTDWTTAVVPIHESVVGSTRPSLLMLFAAVAFVLLIACANVANVLLARAAHRTREIALRFAMGAGRTRIFVQLLTESVLLALLGGVLGLALAYGIMEVVRSRIPNTLPRLQEVSLDLWVLGFSVIVSVLAGIVFGLVPAAQGAKANLHDALKEGGTSLSSNRARRRTRNLLVVAEIALAVVVVVGAGLLMRSLWRLQKVDPGFFTEKTMTATLVLPRSEYGEAEQQRQFFKQLQANLGGLPGVTDVAYTSNLPMSGPFTIGFAIESQPRDEAQPFPHSGSLRIVTDNYFRAMGIPLIRGRGFERLDTPESPEIVVVSQGFANTFFPDADPIGERLDVGFNRGDEPEWREIVGIVGDVHNAGLSSDPTNTYYLLFNQEPVRGMDLVVKTASEPQQIVGAVRSEVNALDPNLAIYRIQTLEEMVERNTAGERFRVTLLSGFALVALLLASVGIYGVMSYTVAQRSREMGIRMALGARSGDMMGLVVGEGLKIAFIGIFVGALASLAATRLIASMLFEVSPADPLTFVSALLFLLAVAAAACWLPALRATRVDPVEALRRE